MMRRILPMVVPISLGLTGCAQIDSRSNDIVLRGYEVSNYAMLDAAIGQRVCVVGTLSADVTGVRFLLRPYEENGVLAPSPSRVRVDISPERAYRERENWRDGQQRRICGVLQDATPWDRCDSNDCKWYVLREPRRG